MTSVIIRVKEIKVGGKKIKDRKPLRLEEGSSLWKFVSCCWEDELWRFFPSICNFWQGQCQTGFVFLVCSTTLSAKENLPESNESNFLRKATATRGLLTSQQFPARNVSRCAQAVWPGQNRTLAVNVWQHEAMKEWNSKALTVKSMCRSAPTDLYNEPCSARYLLCFQSKPGEGHGVPGWPWGPRAHWLLQNLQKSYWATSSKAWKHERRMNSGTTQKISRSSWCTNPLRSPTWHLLPCWKVDCMTHQVAGMLMGTFDATVLT